VSFPLVSLSDVCQINIGKTPARANPNYWGKGHPWLSIADMNQGAQITATKEEITDLGVKESNIKLVRKGTVLFSFKLSIGKIGIAQRDLYTNEAIAALPILDKTKLCEKFLVYALGRMDASKTTDRAVMGATLNKKKLADLEIPLPTLEEQKRIAAILDKADAIRKKRKQAIELTEQFLRSAFLDMFGDPITNPKGWEKSKLENLGALDRGKSKHRPRNDPKLLGGKYPLIQTGDVAASKGAITEYMSTYSEIGLQQSKLWPSGTLCITIAANIAKTGILTFDACFPDSVVGFTPNERTTTEFIQFWLSFYQHILEETAPESAQKNINLKILRELKIPTPPIELQNNFTVIVEKSRKVMSRFEIVEHADDNLFHALMQRAFRGEL